jgi:mannose-6-phosphate isomerase-like protein (cupin superfamily)
MSEHRTAGDGSAQGGTLDGMTAAGAGYPRAVEDGSGDRLIFLGTRLDEEGRRVLDLENRVPPGGGPPMHVHHLQEERFSVEQGRLGYRVEGEEERFAAPGETVTFAAGVAHKFRNAGDVDLVCTGWVSPPHNFEFFIGEIYASARRAGGSRPSIFDIAFLAGRYRSEYAVTDVPQPVQRLVFPLVRGLGRLLGRYRRFADAPPPLKAQSS